MALARTPRVLTDLRDGPTDAPTDGQVLAWDGERYQPRSFAGADRNLVVDLSPPASSFTIVHNLGKRPSVRIVDSAGTELIAEVVDVSGNETNALTVTFNGATSGKAILN